MYTCNARFNVRSLFNLFTRLSISARFIEIDEYNMFSEHEAMFIDMKVCSWSCYLKTKIRSLNSMIYVHWICRYIFIEHELTTLLINKMYYLICLNENWMTNVWSSTISTSKSLSSMKKQCFRFSFLCCLSNRECLVDFISSHNCSSHQWCRCHRSKHCHLLMR